MSIPVDLTALAEALGRHDTAYLLVPGPTRPHVSEVFPRLEGGVLVIEDTGRTARSVVRDNPPLTVMLPPREPAGYTLIIDGDGTVEEAGTLRVTPSHAVLHRAAAHGPQDHASPTGCDNDCRPLAD